MVAVVALRPDACCVSSRSDAELAKIDRGAAHVIVNIVMFHAVLSPAVPMVVLLLSLELYLAWSYRAAFAPMLRVRVAAAVAPLPKASRLAAA